MKLAVLAGVVVIGLGAVAVAADHTHDQAQQPAAATQPAAKPVNTKCPVSGEPIDPTITVVQDGKVVAFCCKDCVEDFKKDPAKYMAKLK